MKYIRMLFMDQRFYGPVHKYIWPFARIIGLTAAVSFVCLLMWMSFDSMFQAFILLGG